MNKKNMPDTPQLTVESYQKIAVFWFALAANHQRWQELLGPDLARWGGRLGIPGKILTECLDSIKRVQSCFEQARHALRCAYCPSPPCDLDLKDPQCQKILDTLLSFVKPGEQF
jgi:hypothetical protein